MAIATILLKINMRKSFKIFYLKILELHNFIYFSLLFLSLVVVVVFLFENISPKTFPSSKYNAFILIFKKKKLIILHSHTFNHIS